MSNLFQPSNSSEYIPDTSNDALISAQLHALYASLKPQEVEQFFQGYSAWQMRQRMEDLQTQLTLVEQRINDNAVLMQLAQPSALSLATLTRLQSYGVEDIDLLDTMLERGDEWLDHTMQLLTHCERLNLIHDNYTEWCRHALEGAYDWLDSINESSAAPLPASPAIQASQQMPDTADTTNAASEEATELLLRKLMDEDETSTDETAQAIEHQNNVQKVQQVEIAFPEQEVSSAEGMVAPSDEQITSSQDELIELAQVQEVKSSNEDEPHNQDTQDSNTQKLPGRSLVARVLARVWNVG